MGRVCDLAIEADESILDNDYEGILDRDGLDAVEAQVRHDHNNEMVVGYILRTLQDVNRDV